MADTVTAIDVHAAEAAQVALVVEESSEFLNGLVRPISALVSRHDSRSKYESVKN